jgi:cell division protein FtsB
MISRALGRLTTRRAALLALVVCGLALSIAVPLHTYLSQRDDLAGQLHQQQVLRAQEKQLEQREQQLSDPAQIEAEARTRLHFVLPGETPYVVQLPGSVPPPAATHGKKSAGQSTSWYDALWSSISGSGG